MRLRMSFATVALLSGAVLGCAAGSEEPPTLGRDWNSRAAKYGESNLVNARSLVAKFCTRGGPFDSSPQESSGPFGFARVDTLGLAGSERSRVVIDDIATGEGGWWRITFNLGSNGSYAFFINPRSRMATCGAAGLRNFRATFRLDNAALQGDELATQVYGLNRNGFVQDVSDQPDDVVCGLAVRQPYEIWETHSGYQAYVEEAQKRGYTPDSCAALTASTSS